jgi:putative transposase
MPRSLRLHAPGAFYPVTLRGNHRQNIFFCDGHRQTLSQLIAEVIDRFGARLHAYCYMTNHIHALIQVGETPLGRIMLRIAGRYARTIQSALHTTGHLFEKRYHPVLVDADEYLLELLRYIHLSGRSGSCHLRGRGRARAQSRRVQPEARDEATLQLSVAHSDGLPARHRRTEGR